MTTNVPGMGLLDPALYEWRLQSYGGYHTSGDGGRVLDWSDFVETLELNDSVRNSGRSLYVTLDYDETMADEFEKIHVGSVVNAYGRRLDPQGWLAPTYSQMHHLYGGTALITDTEQRDGAFFSKDIEVHDILYRFAADERSRTWSGDIITIFKQMLAHHGAAEGFIAVDPNPPNVGQIIQWPGMTNWDVLQEALNRTYDLTGEFYTPRVEYEPLRISLVPFGRTGVTWTIQDGVESNMLSGSYREDATNLRTDLIYYERVPAEDDANDRVKVVTQAQGDDRSKRWFGDLRTYRSPDGRMQDDEGNPILSEVQAATQRDIRRLSKPAERASVDNLYLPGLRQADHLQVVSGATGRSSSWIVETVRHLVRPTGPTMSLDLVVSADALFT